MKQVSADVFRSIAKKFCRTELVTVAQRIMSTVPQPSADLKFPIGRYQPPGRIDETLRNQWIAELEALPENLRKAVAGLSESQLDTPYRPDGWTVRQVVHHLPDSHINSYVRFRLALTEHAPTIKP